MILKEVKVHEYHNTKNLMNVFTTEIISEIENIPEAQSLLAWRINIELNRKNFKNISIAENSKSAKKINRFKSLESIDKESAIALNSPRDKVFNDTLAQIVFLKHECMYYLSCPNEKCSRKVTEGDGLYHCDACQQDFANVSSFPF